MFIETDIVVEHAIEVPLDKLHFHNRTEADHMRKVPPEVGTGYVALIEVFHQLHCLVRNIHRDDGIRLTQPRISSDDTLGSKQENMTTSHSDYLTTH
jgi:hypothetical protein